MILQTQTTSFKKELYQAIHDFTVDTIKTALYTSLADLNENIMTTFGWIMGFRLANYLNITESITSEGMFDAAGDRYIYVAINDYQKNNNSLNMVCFDNSIMEEDIIGNFGTAYKDLFVYGAKVTDSRRLLLEAL